MLALTYALIAVNPVGGQLAAIPFGVFVAHYSLPVVLLSGPPLAFLQVVAVDLAWDRLRAWGWFLHLLERRNARIDRLLHSGGAFLPVFLVTPLLGPWFVAAVMRYAEIPVRRVALAIAASLVTQAVVLGGACVLMPSWFS